MVTKNLKNYDVTGTNEGVLYGLSSDTKPTDATIINGYRFIEMDTKRIYVYDEANSAWRLWNNNNSGEETGVGLNMAGAVPGEVPYVASVDANGTPEAWESKPATTISGHTLYLNL